MTHMKSFIIFGGMMLGLATSGVAQASAYQQIQYDGYGCGPHCQEHRREEEARHRRELQRQHEEHERLDYRGRDFHH